MWQVKLISDREEILDFLQQDRLYAAYAIGDLEPTLFDQCQWFGAKDDGKIQALVLLFTGLHPHVGFTMGDSDGLAAVLDSALQPKQTYFTSRPEHLTMLETYYALGEVQWMLRMAITSADFRPVPGRVLSGSTARLSLRPELRPRGSPKSEASTVSPVLRGTKGSTEPLAELLPRCSVIRLSSAHLNQLRALYRLGGGTAFASYQLRDGIYYGIEANRRLVSAAGTHLVSPTFGVAAVGNVFTHPDYRHRGYATACTSHVVEELLAQGLDVVLNVNRENAEAVGIYERLGFHTYCPFIEVLGVRKDPKLSRSQFCQGASPSAKGELSHWQSCSV